MRKTIREYLLQHRDLGHFQRRSRSPAEVGGKGATKNMKKVILINVKVFQFYGG